MGSIISRFNVADLAILGGCLGLLAIMMLLGPGEVEEDPPSPSALAQRQRGGGGRFWESWPGAIVATIGGGGVLYVLIILYALTHRG